MDAGLRFRLLTPEGEVCSLPCDGVNLTAKDDATGRGGGSMGVRRGHLPAVVALEPGGTLRVMREGKAVFSARVQNGFARIGREEVTVLTPGIAADGTGIRPEG